MSLYLILLVLVFYVSLRNIREDDKLGVVPKGKSSDQDSTQYLIDRMELILTYYEQQNKVPRYLLISLIIGLFCVLVLEIKITSQKVFECMLVSLVILMGMDAWHAFHVEQFPSRYGQKCVERLRNKLKLRKGKDLPLRETRIRKDSRYFITVKD